MGHKRLRAHPAWVRSIGSIGRYKPTAPYAPHTHYAFDSSLSTSIAAMNAAGESTCPLAVEAISFLAFPLRFNGTALRR